MLFAGTILIQEMNPKTSAMKNTTNDPANDDFFSSLFFVTKEKPSITQDMSSAMTDRIKKKIIYHPVNLG